MTAHKKQYKHLFFDLDNTLFDFDGAAKIALQQLFEEQKLDSHYLNFDEFYTTYLPINMQLWDEYKHNLVTKDEVKYGRFDKTLATKNINNLELATLLGDSFLEKITHIHVLIPDCLNVLDQLKPKYKMHIISNGFTEVQHSKLEKTGLAPYFEWVILSEQVKVQKPNRTIFEHAVKNANAKIKESLMIGDNFEADIAGAKNVGMDQAWYMYSNTFSPTFEPTYTINHLTDLLTFL